MAKLFLKFIPFFYFPAFVFLLHIILFSFGVYQRLPWFDIPMHFLGGLAISYSSVLFFRYFKEKGFFSINRTFLFVLIIVSTVSFVAVLWEFFEFFLHLFVSVSFQPSVADTMKDLFIGMLGGLVWGILWRK